nr:hypothetical protein [Caldalkalibacillus uzonensis]
MQDIYWEAVQGVQQAAGDLTLDRLHFDTTSFVYYGSSKVGEDVLNITRGYSKDHRPDLPQIKFGLEPP